MSHFMVSDVPRIVIKIYLHISTFTALNLLCHIKLLNLKYLFVPICAFHTYAVGYEVSHHPPFLLIDLHRIGCKRKLINFNEYNLIIYI
jgi:hypothetical protein